MFQYAQVVRSLAGRDEGQLLAVVREEDGDVWLADGKHRPLERPKRKNPRHIRPLEIECREAMTTNRALRRALRRIAQEASERDA